MRPSDRAILCSIVVAALVALAGCQKPTGLTWVAISGGTYEMGSDEGYGDNRPLHEVTVPDFEMTLTEITVRQYRVCMNAGKCSAPNADEVFYEYYPGWQPGNEDYPMAFVSWDQARAYCSWVGGRLPTEAEWEYAARSGGETQDYPWGSTPATCTYAVMFDREVSTSWGCGADTPMAVCSRPLGNTAQGLCDMAGNVLEWVEDDHHSDYTGAPEDGSAWVDSPRGTKRVTRGGWYGADHYGLLRTDYRWGTDPTWQYMAFGFRCAR